MKQSGLFFFRQINFQYYALVVLFGFVGSISCVDSYSLGELSSALTTLATLKTAQAGDQEPEYLSDRNFFNMLLTKTSNAKLQEKLKSDIEKLLQLSAEQQRLAKYLLHFLFANPAFARLYRNGGAYPNYSYIIDPYNLYAAGSTDLIARILLVITIVDDIKKNWVPHDEIVVASLGGGDLLQDYILIKALCFSSYNKIRLIDIDFSNHTKDLERIIKLDHTLKDSAIKIRYYKSTQVFFSSYDKDEMPINVCYLVSPTYTGPYPIEKDKDVSKLLHEREINFVRIGESDGPSIRFFIPHTSDHSFAVAFYDGDYVFVARCIGSINKFLRENDTLNFFDAIGLLQKKEKDYAKHLYGGDDIMLDFYDIIKNSTLKNCFGYIALDDVVTKYSTIKHQPYFDLDYKLKHIESAHIWAYNRGKRIFEQLK